jgi:O-succinylbenzoic acid--CoA ligase
MRYGHSSLSINGREVQLTDILSQSVTSESDFERETFLFIEKWMNGAESVTLYTSGSTGIPKEITLTRSQLQQSAQRTIKVLTCRQVKRHWFASIQNTLPVK